MTHNFVEMKKTNKNLELSVALKPTCRKDKHLHRADSSFICGGVYVKESKGKE